MARLERPHIPLAVRVQVAERQCASLRAIHCFDNVPLKPKRDRLNALLRKLFGETKCELHHRPALCNRNLVINQEGKTFYLPDANDPDYLVYLPEHDHDIETRVRGIGAMRSDLSQRRYNKRLAANRSKSKKVSRRWPSRPLRSASRWPRKRQKS